MKIRLSDLKAKAETRPEGYYDEVLSKGKVEGDILIIDGDAYTKMVKKFGGIPKSLPTIGGCHGCGKNLKMPPVTTMAKNVIGSATNLVSNIVHGQQIRASGETVEKRTQVCKDCEFWASDKERCSICGCYTKWKISLQHEKCPKGKW